MIKETEEKIAGNIGTLIGVLSVGMIVAILLMGIIQVAHGGNSSYIDYPYAEYQGHVITDLGTFAIYKADWPILQREWETRVKSNIYILSFADRKRGELWYSEGLMDKALERFKFWKSPREKELENIGSIREWNKAVFRDRSDEQKVTWYYQEKMFKFDLKGKPIF